MHIQLKTKLPGPKSNRILQKLKQKNAAFNLDHLFVHSGKGEGSHFQDVDGNTFLDFASQVASNPLGYNNAAMLRVLQKHSSYTPFKYGGQDFTVPQHEELLDELLKIVPREMNAAFLINSGAEANENALKIAVRHNPSARIGISFVNGWHGRTTGALSLTNAKAVQVKQYFKIPVRHLQYDESAIEELELLMQREFDPTEIGFVIMECVQGEGGYHIAPTKMVQGIRKLTRKYNIPLISDEVQAGMGITGKWWAYQHYDITPDIQTCGKKLQVAATVANRRLFPKEKGAISSTWGGGHVLDMAMGAAIIREIKKQKLLHHAEKMGKEVRQRLKEIELQFPSLIMQPRGLGLMNAFDLPTNALRGKFIQECFKRGLIVLGCGIQGVRVIPALNVTKKDIGEGMEIIAQAASKLNKEA
ncbi:MAG: aminotransferase class III-fold pyridoxal phosphate-dependent enzyme [Candidatus Iainarchaeum archaeon]|uniref:Aminotransferase class III-fold pyridoxal phosphate-dependent enzyme n=1 Tax=Candidatus Iainarchaeum sp. TaxID=3101447 RepID=A0A7T9DK15_9ARCH|nr:MAG: aminotransferase class III-fold pyridoxal phosphate-dependent enzyme [Candidatus Diapherotrites archaeon]